MKKGKSFGHLLAGLQKVILRGFTALMSTCTSGSCVTGTMKVLREQGWVQHLWMISLMKAGKSI